MDPLFTLLSLLAVLILIDFASLRWGANSRHTRDNRHERW
jgi:hypothetical protein